MVHHGILLSDKKKWTTDTNINLDRPSGNYPEGKNPIAKSYILYDSISITFLKWQKYDREQMN